MHILHTVLYTFQKVLTRRICLMIKSILTLLSFLYSYDLTSSFRGDIVIRNYMLITLRSWELTRGPDDFGMLILYFSHIQVFRCRNFWGRGQGEGVGRVQTTVLYLNLALICQPDCYIAYYKLFIFEYHRQSTLLKRNVLGDMTCTLTTQSKTDDDLLCKS